MSQFHTTIFWQLLVTTENVAISYGVVPLLEADGNYRLWWIFNKIDDNLNDWSWYMGYTSKWQFYTEGSHFWRQMVTIDYDELAPRGSFHHHKAGQAAGQECGKAWWGGHTPPAPASWGHAGEGQCGNAMREDPYFPSSRSWLRRWFLISLLKCFDCD